MRGRDGRRRVASWHVLSRRADGLVTAEAALVADGRGVRAGPALDRLRSRLGDVSPDLP